MKILIKIIKSKLKIIFNIKLIILKEIHVIILIMIEIHLIINHQENDIHINIKQMNNIHLIIIKTIIGNYFIFINKNNLLIF